jgi:hypothetical protein
MKDPGLFPLPTAELLDGIADLPRILAGVFPLQARHREALPGGIRKLSDYLTLDREHLPRDYMSRPEFLAAYLHYFMPWNIYRQGRLLVGLDLALKPQVRIVDLGAGPLTFLHALWLTRPGLREQELDYLAVDRSESALKNGRKIFRAWAPEAKWTLRTDNRPAGQKKFKPADLLVMTNFINEVERTPRAARGEQGVAREALLLDKWESQVAPNGAILLVEPGVRDAGRFLTRLREAALGKGWSIPAPCPHPARCPLPGLRSTPWCHFTFPTGDVPGWLARLSHKAKLPKARASLSFLLLVRGEDPPLRIRPPRTPGKSAGLVRVVSEGFDLPGGKQGRYGCSGRGLILLETHREDQGPVPGDLVTIRWPDKSVRDRKSGGLVVPLASPRNRR